MKLRKSILVILILLLMPASASATPAWQSKVDPWVLETAEAAESGETEFLVYLREQADLSAAASLPTKAEKGAYVFRQLREMAKRTQPPLIAALKAMGVAYQPYWVANMIWVRGDGAAVQALALRPDVAHLYANPSVQLQAPIEESDQVVQVEAPDTVQDNLIQIHADEVWARGFTGQGAVIGGQDTGYDWDHPALINAYRGWNGATADHDFNWHDAIHSGAGTPCPSNSPVPCDGYSRSHGTHTMGIMVGDDGATHQIGVAPGARWIGCRNMNNSGAGTPATYTECYQWFMAPTDISGVISDTSKAPDVINNSWGCTYDEGCRSPNALLSVVENVRAAGIMTVHSAGNSGGNTNDDCESVSEPAAIYAASFTVGAVYGSDAMAEFSSRGPVAVDGSNRRKPDVVAPGVGILSSIRGTGYNTMDGTSMAAPHVAGLVALLISVDPSLRGDVDALEDLIESTAVEIDVDPVQTCGGIPSSQIPNNTFGWGRVDAFLAARLLLHPFYMPLLSR